MKIASPENDVWTDACPRSKSDYLEHLLFLIKEKRNLVGHKDKRITNLDNKQLEDIFKETKLQIHEIIVKAAAIGNVNNNEIRKINTKLEAEIEHIRIDKLPVTNFDKNKILEFLKKEDVEKSYLKDLEDYFMGEMKSFTSPSFVNKSDNSVTDLRDLLTTIGGCQVAIIEGDAGSGKTSLSK